MLFSLKLQRDNRKNTLAVDPAKGKNGEKAVFSPHHTVEMKQPYPLAEPFKKGNGNGLPWQGVGERAAGRRNGFWGRRIGALDEKRRRFAFFHGLCASRLGILHTQPF